MKDLLAV